MLCRKHTEEITHRKQHIGNNTMNSNHFAFTLHWHYNDMTLTWHWHDSIGVPPPRARAKIWLVHPDLGLLHLQVCVDPERPCDIDMWHVTYDALICHMPHDVCVCVCWRECDIWRVDMSHAPFVCGMPLSYVPWCIDMWCDAFWYVVWRLHVRHAPFICQVSPSL